MIVTKPHLICPGNEVNRELHQKIDRKKDLYYEDALPASVQQELKQEIIQMKRELQAQVAASLQARPGREEALHQ